MMTKLDPCPFCGATSEKFTLSQELTERYELGHALKYPYWPIVQELKLSCPCGCSFEKEVLHVSEFVEAWNRRVKDDKR